MADGFAMLEHDHRAVGEMFDDYEQVGDPAVAKQICFELTAHGELEEQVVYFDLRDFGDKTSQLADSAEEANDLINQTIGRIGLAEPDDVPELMASLRSTVEGHVREEEEDMFPEMRDLGVDPEKLGRDLEAARGAAVARAREKLG
jgi:hemerythrin superfamily protein